MEETQGAKGSPRGFEGAATQTGLPHGYHSGQRVLLVGEGNLPAPRSPPCSTARARTSWPPRSIDRVARAAFLDLRDIEQSRGPARRASAWTSRTTRSGKPPGVVGGGNIEARAANERGGAAAPAMLSGAGPGGFFKGSTAWYGTSQTPAWASPGVSPCRRTRPAGRVSGQRSLLSRRAVHVAMRACEHRARWNVAGARRAPGTCTARLWRLRPPTSPATSTSGRWAGVRARNRCVREERTGDDRRARGRRRRGGRADAHLPGGGEAGG